MKAKANISELHTAHLIQLILSEPNLMKVYLELKAKGWIIQAVNQQRGRCYYKDKTITVPVWALESTRKGYDIYYIAHEFAHTQAIGHEHDSVFMEQFKLICPAEFHHHELGYKPRNAASAGISQKEIQHKAPVKINWEDLL